MAACTNRDGFACYGGTEIWNVCRTLTYVDTLLPRAGFQLTVQRDNVGSMCCGCCDTVYTDVATDEPPWYDPGVPESTGFFGIIPIEIDGLGNQPAVRTATSGINGTSIGALTEAGREIDVVAVAYADSCEAMDYGMAWLQATLERDCGTAGFTWQGCCPSGDVSPSDLDALNYRTIPCIAMTEGIFTEPWNPEVLQGYAYQIEFSLASRKSWIYEQPVTLFDGLLIPGPGQVVVDYTPTCVDGAAIEVFVDRSLNTGTTTDLAIYSGRASYFPANTLEKWTAQYGCNIVAGPGQSIFYDPRCLGIAIASITGKATQPADRVSLLQNSRGLFQIAEYGKTIRLGVEASDNALGQIGVRIRAHPRRRI